jgi:hypothetical protein
MFRFDAGVSPEKNQSVTGGGLDGVAFEVRPITTRDCGRLRLQITQRVSRLVAINKLKKLDALTGERSEIEVPAVQQSSTTGTVQVLDGNPLLMPVDYQPPGERNADTVWLLVARPIIWLESEQEELRKAGTSKPPQAVWDRPLQPEEKPTLALETR